PGAPYHRVYANTTLDHTTATAISTWVTGDNEFHNSAIPGQTYYYWVSAAADSGGLHATELSNFSVSSGWRALNTPTVDASDGTYTSHISISWNSVPGATHYKLFYSPVNDRSTAMVARDWSSATAYTHISGITPEITYYYWVKAATSATGTKASAYSDADTGWMAWTPLPYPTGVDSSDGTYNTKIRVTWDEVTEANAYRVYRSTSTAANSFIPISDWNGHRIYDDFTATPGVTYFYRVQSAVNLQGGRASNLSIYDSGYRSLVPPDTISASDGDYSDHVHLEWNRPEGATHFRVYRAESSNPNDATAIGPWQWQTETSYDDFNVTPCTTYFYRIKAGTDIYGNHGTDVSLNYATGHSAMLPPTSVTASDGTYGDKIEVTWNSIPEAGIYRVYRNTVDDPNTAQAQGPAITATSYDDIYATKGQTYYYWVKAAQGPYMVDCPTDFSSSDAGWIDLSTPGNMTASDGTFYAHVHIDWDSVTGATHYSLARSETPTGDPDGLGMLTTTSYDDETAVPGQTYYYWVQAMRQTAGGRSSTQASDTGWRALTAPTAVYATNGTYSYCVNITWSSVEGATHYRVYRHTYDVVGGATPLDVWQSETFYDDTTAVPGETYYYWVKAAASDSGEHESDFSNSDAGWRGLPEPENLTASDGTITSHVLVNWDSVSGASHYCVFRSPTGNPSDGGQLGGWGTETSYEDTSVTPGLTYYYWVKAANNSSGDNASNYSAPDTGWRAEDCDGDGTPDQDEPDSDDDGVIDDCDNCPGTPSGVMVDENGCPPPCVPPVIYHAESIMTHGTVGQLPLYLLYGGSEPVIESRYDTDKNSVGPTLMVVYFMDSIQAYDGSLDAGDEVLLSSGTIDSLSIINNNELHIDMRGADNNTCLIATLHGLASVSDGTCRITEASVMPDTDIKVKVILGEVNYMSPVNIFDLGAIKREFSQPLGEYNFFMDVNTDGNIDIDDIYVIRSNVFKPQGGLTCP
ncbi:MAG: hypothetical protein JSV03_13795, partial [Planctomycetota bacterium]